MASVDTNDDELARRAETANKAARLKNAAEAERLAGEAAAIDQIREELFFMGSTAAPSLDDERVKGACDADRD